MLVLAPGTGVPGRLTIPGVEVATVGPSVRVPVNGSRAPVAPWPSAMRRGLRALARFGPDVVHVHEPLVPGASLAAALFGRGPLVATFHRAGPGLGYRIFARSAGALAIRRLDVVVAVSEEARTTAAVVTGLERDRIRVVTNGVELDATSSVPPIEASSPTVVFAGRHEPRKGLAVLLEAARLLPPTTRIWVIGAGPETAGLRERFARDDRVEWLGALGDDERAARVAAGDVFVAPSLGGESFGVVLLEAMAVGTAVVASDLPGYRLAAGSAADLVPPGEPGELARAIEALLGDEHRRSELVARGLERALECSMTAVASSYLSLYRSAVATATGG